jgi:hypothetical protein
MRTSMPSEKSIVFLLVIVAIEKIVENYIHSKNGIQIKAMYKGKNE